MVHFVAGHIANAVRVFGSARDDAAQKALRDSFTSASFVERTSIAVALGVLTLLVCHAFALALGQSGLPRDASLYKLTMLIIASVMLVVPGRIFVRDFFGALKKRVLTWSAFAGAMLIAAFTYSFLSLVPTLHMSSILYFDGVVVLIGFFLLLMRVLQKMGQNESKIAPVSIAGSSVRPLGNSRRLEVVVEVKKGEPRVCEVLALDGRVSEGEVHWLAACLSCREQGAVYHAVTESAKVKNIHLKHAEHFSVHNGALYGTVEGRRIRLRNPDHDDRYPEVNVLKQEGKTVLMVDQNDKTVGAVALC